MGIRKPMFGYLQNWRERRIIAHSEITPQQWQTAFAGLPLLRGLSADETQRLREMVILFCHRKSFEGAHGLEVSLPMALTIALQACLPILELGLECYDEWHAIIVYPEGFAPEQVFVDEYGVAHEVREELSGEAWQRGPVLLSWSDSNRAGQIDGYNLVIHEFAHKLDMLNGEANGFPPLHADMNAEVWTEIFSAGFEDFRHKCETGIELGIDDYAATSPAEYFAVMSEAFFELPQLLRQHYPSVYAQLRRYYRQDPGARLSLRAPSRDRTACPDS